MEEYELEGTLAGIKCMLQDDFQMSEEEARFFEYILINQDKTSDIDKKEVDAWYLNQEEKYTGQILNTHYVINFTNIKKELFHNVYIFLFDYFFSKGFDIFQFGAELLFVICTAIQHIEDVDYCVFARIVELNIGNKGRLFSANEIITANKEQKCDHQEDDWKCPYLREHDTCINSTDKIQLSLRRLDKQEVIKPVGNFWVLQ